MKTLPHGFKINIYFIIKAHLSSGNKSDPNCHHVYEIETLDGNLDVIFINNKIHDIFLYKYYFEELLRYKFYGGKISRDNIFHRIQEIK